MDHQKYKELLTLSACDDIDSQEKQLLDEHLTSCEDCRNELLELKKMLTSVTNKNFTTIDNSLLTNARRDLRMAIYNEQLKENWFSLLRDKIKNYFLGNLKLALTGTAALAAGLGIGFILFSQNHSQDLQSQFASYNQMFSESDMKISNVHFLDSDASDNEISFTFDAVKPIKMKGKLKDEFIQKVLAYSLINEANDGVRLRTVNAISEQTEQKIFPDQRIKTSLIEALKFDLNPGVRREALIVLKKLPFDEEIKEAFLYVLLHDENAGLRIAAINSIIPGKLTDESIDEDMLNILKQKVQSDKNEYIRLRAKTVLEEVIQNENL